VELGALRYFHKLKKKTERSWWCVQCICPLDDEYGVSRWPKKANHHLVRWIIWRRIHGGDACKILQWLSDGWIFFSSIFSLSSPLKTCQFNQNQELFFIFFLFQLWPSLFWLLFIYFEFFLVSFFFQFHSLWFFYLIFISNFILIFLIVI
jgi:hypothetical protein